MSSEYLDNVPSLASAEDNYDLMKPFSEKEIFYVIWAMESEKAPGPDGFSFHFYKVCWPIIKSDPIRIVSLPFKRRRKKQKWEGVITL